MLRGSREYGSSVNGSTIEKFTTSVFCVRNGSTKALVTSGINPMSDSWMAWKPRIDDPSNARPSVKADSTNASTGMLKCCMTPGRSQNRTSTNLTPCSLVNAMASSASLNIRMLLGSGYPGLVPSTLGRSDYLVVYLTFPMCYQPTLVVRV